MITILDRNFGGTVSVKAEDYPEGIVIVVDKPYQWTSADVIRKLKFAAIRHFGKRNLKVGHAGTLDPLATGVLLVCIGNACKKAQSWQATDKEYIAGICLGATTPSYDREKEIDRLYPTEGITADGIKRALTGFLGEQDQVAPLFSAKQVDGVRAYELARKMHSQGLSLDDAARSLLQVNRIRINETELLDLRVTTSEDCAGPEPAGGASGRINVNAMPEGLPLAVVRIACSKGTYIRALARDLGERLNSGAFLHSLARSRCGEFRVEDALSVNEAAGLLSLFP